ncbi:MAG: hypothetical protein V4529_17565 [Gemmatimonadota bacterium]
MAVYAGRKGVVYLSTSGSGTASSVLKLTDWSLDQSTDKIDVTAFGDANKTYVQGLKDVKGTFSGFFDDTEAKPFTGADSSDGVKLYLYPSSDAAGKYFYGPAWLDVSIKTGVAGAVAMSGNFAANGSWGRV